MTTEPTLGFTWIVNSLFLVNCGVSEVKVITSEWDACPLRRLATGQDGSERHREAIAIA